MIRTPLSRSKGQGHRGRGGHPQLVNIGNSVLPRNGPVLICHVLSFNCEIISVKCSVHKVWLFWCCSKFTSWRWRISGYDSVNTGFSHGWSEGRCGCTVSWSSQQPNTDEAVRQCQYATSCVDWSNNSRWWSVLWNTDALSGLRCLLLSEKLCLFLWFYFDESSSGCLTFSNDVRLCRWCRDWCTVMPWWRPASIPRKMYIDNSISLFDGFSALTLLVRWQEGHVACETFWYWLTRVCLEDGR